MLIKWNDLKGLFRTFEGKLASTLCFVTLHSMLLVHLNVSFAFNLEQRLWCPFGISLLGDCCILYPFQTGLKTQNVIRRTFCVHPRPLSVWKVAGWSPPGEHGTNSGWTRREVRARPSSTNTEHPPEDVPCLPQTAASMKGLGTHTVCKPEPEVPEWTLVDVLCSFWVIIIHKFLFISNERELSGCRAIWSKCLINLHNYSFILTTVSTEW